MQNLRSNKPGEQIQMQEPPLQTQIKIKRPAPQRTSETSLMEDTINSQESQKITPYTGQEKHYKI
jgi:hypothetical protein